MGTESDKVNKTGEADEIIIGIDLGTTNSLVAYSDARGPVILRKTVWGVEDSGIVPSVIGFSEETGRVEIGAEARARAVELPETTVFSVKRLMGKGYSELTEELEYLPYRVVERASAEDGRDLAAVDIRGKMYTPPELSAMVLRELKRRAEAHFGREVREAVITVPAYFDDAQRQATRDAGKIAGLNVRRIVNEPTAAALAYGLDRQEDACIAVYDLGGGTFDVSILRVSDGISEVLSTHGDTHLGGDDFDRKLIELVQGEVADQFGLNIDSPAIKQQLRNYAEEIKVRLSERDEAALEVSLGDKGVYRRTVTRGEFESMIDPLVGRTIDSCRQALRDAKLAPEEVDEVVLVGGSTRIPLVRRRVAELFGRKPYTALNPDEVVALGAAVQASILSGVTRDLLLLDVTPLSLGIETLGGAMGKLILRNARIPCQAKEMFTTFVDGQTNIKINVLQGERELASDCRSLGAFELCGIPPMAAGMPKIEVTFLIDQNGILNVSALEQRSDKEASIQVIPAHGLTREEVDRMEQESIEHAIEDMTAHRLIDLRNQVEFDTNKAEQMLARVGEAYPPPEREKLEQAIADLRAFAADSRAPNAIYEKLNAFDKSTVRLAELAITNALKEA